MKLSKRQYSLLLTIAWLLIIFILSVAPANPTPKKMASWFSFQNIDKLGHFLAYSLLAFLLIRTIVMNIWSYKQAVIYSLLLTITYGLAMEVIQGAFLPNRYFEMFDILANIMGSLMGVISHVAFFHNVKPKV